MRRIATATTLVACLSLLLGTAAASPADDVRQVARAAGLGSLHDVPVPTPRNLGDVLRSGSSARKAALQLGKALFWDTQVGSDGQACGSCHYHAGADDRVKNQLHPSGADGTPNTTLGPDDFPFHALDDPLDRTSSVLHDTAAVCSSQGVFDAEFAGLRPRRPDDAGTLLADPVFQVGGIDVRRVEPRNAPSVIDAVFNATNFWDGRAHAVFNGANGAGPLDPAATVLVSEGGTLVPETLRLEPASLASQAVEPPSSDVEMAFGGRSFRDLGRKLLRLRPLGQQLVHPKDSVLGSKSRAKLDRSVVVGKPGLTVAYDDLVKRAFEPRFWESSRKVDGYTQMEANFALFFGVAVEMYESTLIADRTPFDAFMEGDDRALSDQALAGLLVFVNRGDRPDDPLLASTSPGNCVACHSGPELTGVAARDVAAHGPIDVAETATLAGTDLVVATDTAFRDHGFSNIGVRPTAEDPGRGGVLLGSPLAAVRQALAGLPVAPSLPACGGAGEPSCPLAGRTLVDGAFKVPGLRNVELTGPYFHNGGQATLRQAIVFYERQGDFSNVNVADLDPELARVHFVEDDEDTLEAFLLSLTDERVRQERAPFDHPAIAIPNGHPGDGSALTCVSHGQACDDLLAIPAVGAGGRPAAGLPPLAPFLAP